MTQEEKELLLADLCARLPYRVMVNTGILKDSSARILVSIEPSYNNPIWNSLDFTFNGHFHIEELKPYLRSMSSMTAEEKEELRQEQIKDEQLFADCIRNHPEMRGLIIPHFAADWCDKNMFDYRGLIENGLALEAPEDMYYV